MILAAIKAVADSGKPVNRDNVRDAIQASKVKTLQGEVSFDENGDLNNKIISVFKIVKDPNHPLDDPTYQYRLHRRGAAKLVSSAFLRDEIGTNPLRPAVIDRGEEGIRSAPHDDG